MDSIATPHAMTMSIAAVERDTGLSKDTLRVWERRYGFPAPQRDAFGERAYPLYQLEKLRVVKRLLDAGHRPGRIVSQDMVALQLLSNGITPTPQQLHSTASENLQTFMLLIQSHDADKLRRTLSQSIQKMGLAAFICDLVAPLNVLVGDAWTRGQLKVFEEHLYTESMQTVLRHAIHTSTHQDQEASPQSLQRAYPRVLLTTFPNELHSLGLLMAEVMLSLESCTCLSLGTQTPIADIVQATNAENSDIVALGFTASHNAKDALNGLIELRHRLPESVEIWVGGHCPAILRRPIAGVTTLVNLQDISVAVGRWRASHSPLHTAT